MKNKLVKIARKTLPKGTLKNTENAYRITRTKMVSLRYGNPARGLRIIAVTGTNGKTTTACYINEILKEAGFKTALFTTAVIEIAGQEKLNDLNATVPTVAKLFRFFRAARRKGVEYVILEATSHALWQHKFDGVPIEAAVMTNLTQDHLDYHKTMKQYAAAKAKLFEKKPKYIVLNRDDAWFDYFNQFTAREQKMTYGMNPEAEAHITHVKLYKKGTEASLLIDHQTHLELATNLPGEFNVMNMSAAVSLAYLLGIKLEDIQEGVANLEVIPGRFERVDNKLGIDIIVDYAHTPDALEKLLKTTQKITKGRLILVFGACGDRDQSKRPIMGELAANLADRIFLTDEESYNEDPDEIRAMVRQGIEKTKKSHKMTEVADRKQAISQALQTAARGDTVLITGMGHEQYRIVNGKRIPWNDKTVASEIIAEIGQENRKIPL